MSTTTGPSGHAKHSPSKLRLLELCPSYQSDNTGDKSAANRGTAQHAAVETGDDSGIIPEELANVEKVRAYIAPYLAAAGNESTAQIHKELKLDVGGLTWGTCDLVIVVGDHADQFDYKFGINGVDHARTNLQGQAYVLGVFEKFPALETVTMHFILPRRDEVTTHTFKRKDCEKIRLRVARVVARANELAGKEFKPSDKACLYCGAKASCPAMAKAALQIADKYEEEFQLPAEYHPSQISSPVQMAKALDVSRIIGKWVDSVKHHALELVKGGGEIPGYEMRRRSANLEITDPIAAYAAVSDVLTQEEFITACKVSATGLKEAAAKKAPRGQKAKAELEVMDRLTDADLLVRTRDATEFLAKKRG